MQWLDSQLIDLTFLSVIILIFIASWVNMINVAELSVCMYVCIYVQYVCICNAMRKLFNVIK